MASSTELSATSQTRWCRPNSPVEPIYIAGRLRTASSPPRTLMEVASYLCPVAFAGAFSFSPIFWRAPGFQIGEGGRAESLARHLPALAGLPCPLAQLRTRFKNRAGLEGILLHPATVGGSGGARRRLCGPLRAKFRQLNRSLRRLTFWREREPLRLRLALYKCKTGDQKRTQMRTQKIGRASCRERGKNAEVRAS